MPTLLLTPAASEPLRTTLLRTVPLALIIGTIATFAFRNPHASTHFSTWLASVAAALWITFGGHYIELLYLHHVLPRTIPNLNPDPPAANQPGHNLGHNPEPISRTLTRLAARCAVWAIGGSALWLCAVSTYLLITAARLPHASELPMIALQGALGFIIIELFIIHVAFTVMRRPSAWKPRSGRWG